MSTAPAIPRSRWPPSWPPSSSRLKPRHFEICGNMPWLGSVALGWPGVHTPAPQAGQQAARGCRPSPSSRPTKWPSPSTPAGGRCWWPVPVPAGRRRRIPGRRIPAALGALGPSAALCFPRAPRPSAGGACQCPGPAGSRQVRFSRGHWAGSVVLHGWTVSWGLLTRFSQTDEEAADAGAQGAARGQEREHGSNRHLPAYPGSPPNMSAHGVCLQDGSQGRPGGGARQGLQIGREASRRECSSVQSSPPLLGHALGDSST